MGRLGLDKEEVDRRLVSRLRRRRHGVVTSAPSLVEVDTGWLNLTTFSDDAAIGTRAWVIPTNAVNSDNNDATIFGHSGTPTVSHYLKGLQLASGVPASATIVGVEVRIEKQAGDVSITDHTVSLVVGGTVSGDNKANVGVGWPASDTYVVHGGPSDLWGLALTAADVNGATFGVVLAINSAVNFITATVDHIQMKIYYIA